MAKSKFKPMSFSTTLRNPERIGSFLKCLSKYEGRVLDNELIYLIIKDILKEKLYYTYYLMRNQVYKNIYKSDSATFSDDEVQDIILNSPQKHKEAGFEYGWPSRFDTWYKLPMEFGFVKYAMDSPIIISETGHMLIDAVSGDKVDNEKIQSIFLNAMARYQTSNPFRKIENSNVPLVLLLNVIKKLKEQDPDSVGIARQELSFFICWPDDDADALFDKILSFRKAIGISHYTDEIIYNECLSILGYGEEGKNYIKINKVTGEAVDEYIRKMRITGVLSLRGNGRFLDWNTLKQDKIDYVIEHFNSYTTYEDIDSYYDYMGAIDPKLFSEDTKIDENTLDTIRNRTLNKMAAEYTSEYIFNELRIVSSRHESKDDLFKFIPAPARYEFLISIALVQNFKNLDVRPNYPIDDEGIPTNTASGGMGDIECIETNTKELVEVSLIQGRSQVVAEMIPITRHLSDLKSSTGMACMAIFIAPSIHADAIQYSKWEHEKDNIDIITCDTEHFIDFLSTHDELSMIYSVGCFND